MSRTSSAPSAKINLPLIVLWVAVIVVTVAGYLLLTGSNAEQANLYTSQATDYNQYFAAQSGSTVGGMMLVAGVLGALIALAAQVVARGVARAALATAAVATDEAVFGDDDDDLLEDEASDQSNEAELNEAESKQDENTSDDKDAAADVEPEPTKAR